MSLACGDRGWFREDGNQSCIPLAPYVHHGISTSPARVHILGSIRSGHAVVQAIFSFYQQHTSTSIQSRQHAGRMTDDVGCCMRMQWPKTARRVNRRSQAQPSQAKQGTSSTGVRDRKKGSAQCLPSRTLRRVAKEGRVTCREGCKSNQPPHAVVVA